MKKLLKLIIIPIVAILILGSCSEKITLNENKKIKATIDKVLSNEGMYEGSVTKYISKDDYYTSNYYIFYSLFLGEAKLNKYESELRSVTKEANKYIACMVINMEATPIAGTEGDENSKTHDDTATGENVPVQVTLKKEGNEFYIIKTKEYDSLDQAIKNNKGFK